jgi:hypothetical protein
MMKARSAQNSEIKKFSAFLTSKQGALRAGDHLRAARDLRGGGRLILPRSLTTHAKAHA